MISWGRLWEGSSLLCLLCESRSNYFTLEFTIFCCLFFCLVFFSGKPPLLHAFFNSERSINLNFFYQNQLPFLLSFEIHCKQSLSCCIFSLSLAISLSLSSYPLVAWALPPPLQRWWLLISLLVLWGMRRWESPVSTLWDKIRPRFVASGLPQPSSLSVLLCSD